MHVRARNEEQRMTKEMMRQQKAHEEAELAQKNHEKQMEQKNAIAQRLA